MVTISTFRNITCILVPGFIIASLLITMICAKEYSANGNRGGGGKHRTGSNRLPAASVQIDNSTSLDPYKDNYLFKRQIIILLLPNYRQLGGIGGIPYSPGMNPGLTPGQGLFPGQFPGAGIQPGFGFAPGNGIFRTTGGISSAAAPALIPGGRGYRKPASMQF